MESYDFDAKQKYRETVWSLVDRRMRKPKALRRAAYLDTRDGLETIFLLDRGYTAENLLAVNRDPIEVAMLTKKLDATGRPRVGTAGVEWLRAIREAPFKIDVLNFDGTGNFGFRKNCLTIGGSMYAAMPRILAFNLLAGRETGLAAEWVKAGPDSTRSDRFTGIKTQSGRDVRESHSRRVHFAFVAACEFPVFCGDEEYDALPPFRPSLAKRYWDVYLSSSGQPMAWLVAELSWIPIEEALKDRTALPAREHEAQQRAERKRLELDLDDNGREELRGFIDTAVYPG